jgi:hypothetical protein
MFLGNKFLGILGIKVSKFLRFQGFRVLRFLEIKILMFLGKVKKFLRIKFSKYKVFMV